MKENFDKNGLRFNIAELQDAMTRVKEMSVAEMAKYVDAVTHHHYNNLKWLTEQFPLTEDLSKIDWRRYNMTSFGNTAFIAKYTSHKAYRDQALKIIDAFKKSK